MSSITGKPFSAILYGTVALVGLGVVVSLLRAAPSPFVTTPPAATAAPASTESYTFPSVVHTPEETARARLVCAEAGDYGWGVALRRERTGLTEKEALALLKREHGGTPAFAPLEHITYLSYGYPADTDGATPERVRGFVQRVCLREMLGSLAEPTAPPPVPPPLPAQPRQRKGK
jgi:hypothetical protein